ncbi:MAG: MFS transporter [Gemmatimonadota bacterium]
MTVGRSSPETAPNATDDSRVLLPGAGRRLAVLLACLFVTMIGFGITLPVLPFYTERLALRAGATAGDVAMQVGLLTAVYPLMQLIFAPLWGRWSDSIGRRRLVLLGMAGTAAGQLSFALAGSLAALYGARVIGGILSSAIFPAAAAYVADSTTERHRGRGMAWLGTATSLGVVVGPALGGLLARTGWELTSPSGVVLISGFAVPFLAAAALAMAALLAASVWLPESRSATRAQHRPEVPAAMLPAMTQRGALRTLLALAAAGQLGLALFEATFALYAKRMWDFGPAQVGAAFMVCGLVMALAQTGFAALLAQRVGEFPQIATGFALVGASLVLLPLSRGVAMVLLTIGLLAFGFALITPNLSAMIATLGGPASGTALGAQGAANSVGQLGGIMLGAGLLAWNMEAPYVAAGASLLLTGLLLGWRTAAVHRAAR